MRRGAFILAVAFAALLPLRANAGKVGGTMARYGLAGAGIGALLGATSAAVPYLSDHQPFDFMVGAGAGALGGCLTGLIFGAVDLATDKGSAEEAVRARQSPVFAFQSGSATYLAWKTEF